MMQLWELNELTIILRKKISEIKISSLIMELLVLIMEILKSLELRVYEF